jgi:outer membrane lipoprotein SlyB
VIGLGNGTRLSLLWHSLLLPLAGLLLGSWLGSTVGGGDGSVLLGAVVGFVGGLLLCKARRFDVLNVRFGNVKFQADK